MMERKNYGTLGKVGVFGGDVAIADFHRWLHPDILVSAAPANLGSLTSANLMDLSAGAEMAMHNFRRHNPVDLAFFSCTSGSFIGGPGYDAKLCHMLKEASGAREAYTTTTSVLEALRTLGSKRITIVTPYPPDINAAEKAYFENEGFSVDSIDCIATADPRDSLLIPKIPPEDIYRFALEHMSPDSNTLFLSCTGLTVFELIDDLERRLGVPVISSNLSSAWMIGKFFGNHGPNAGKLGSLFTM